MKPTTTECDKELRRTVIRDPEAPSEEIQVFADWEKAILHLCKHVLSAPECHGWALLMRRYRSIINPDDVEGMFAFGKEAHATCGVSAQELFDEYAKEVEKTVVDAAILGWRNRRGHVLVGLGSSGVLVVIENGVLKTAFFPDQGETESSAKHQSQRDIVLPKQRRIRSGHRHRVNHETEEQRRQRWADSSPEEQLYHLYFRPAVQFVRKQYHASLDWQGEPQTVDYALLKDVLPRCSKLKFDSWQRYRTQCG